MVFTTSITEAEILHGIRLLPAGRRRQAFEEKATAMFEEDFGGRVLAFESGSPRAYASTAADRLRAGRPNSQFNAQIAAIAAAHGASLATATSLSSRAAASALSTHGRTDRAATSSAALCVARWSTCRSAPPVTPCYGQEGGCRPQRI